MSAVEKQCRNCNANFTITDEDFKFYEKISPAFDGKKFLISPPTLCPDCRQQRRLTYRNDGKLYRNKCALTGKEVISIYNSEVPCTIYDQQVWWSDNWDPKKYARDFDFSRSFFEQYNELSLKVPRPCILNMSSENSLYTNHSAYNKDCYMCMNTGYSEDLLYCTHFNIHNKNCTDCLGIQKCELCYFCVNTKNSSFSNYLLECKNCSDCEFCYDCQGCHDCFACYNLRHKKFCIFNEQYSEEEYKEKLKTLKPKDWSSYEKFFQEFLDAVNAKAIHRAAFIENCQNSTGDHLFNNKSVTDSYYVFDSEDCKYCHDCGALKDSYDTLEPYQGELQFESHGCNLGYNLIVCSKCYEDNNCSYCQYCWYSSNLFGCFGMRRAKYCILNKQYKKEEYEKLVSRIINMMLETGEWGEFFPIKLSTFGYNETAAMDYYPMTKEEVIAKGWKWHDE